MAQTLSQRVLKIAATKGVFNSKIAFSRFTSYWSDEVDGSIMRRARELKAAGLLKRKSRGQYVPTVRGLKAVA